jgi:hypothetical protein
MEEKPGDAENVVARKALEEEGCHDRAPGTKATRRTGREA